MQQKESSIYADFGVSQTPNVFDRCKEKIILKKTRIEDSMQPPLIAPFSRPTNRDVFWRDFTTVDFNVIAKRYAEYGYVNLIKKKVRGLRNRIAKFLRG